MKKIFIKKDDTKETVLAAVAGEAENELTLVFPKGTKLSTTETLGDIRDQAAASKKSISLESVDEKLITLAQSLGLDAHHPFFSVHTQGQVLSDIVAPSGKKRRGGAEVPVPREARPPESPASPPTGVTEDVAANEEGADVKEAEPRKPYGVAPAGSPETTVSRHRARSLIVGILVIAVVVGAGVWITDTFFSWAKITIRFRTVPWSGSSTVTVSKAATAADAATATIPGEVFTQNKSLTQLFPATGHVSTPQKASGVITVYNNYGTASQELVATTRFQTPDGKVFRLQKTIVVPGAVKSGRSLTPSFVDAAVTADKAGPDYNVSSSLKLSIPGFSRSPKAKGFYGVVKQISGGSFGNALVASPEDIQSAKDKTTQILKKSLSDPALNNWSADFTVVDGAASFTVTKMAVNPALDEKGNFSVYAAGAYRAVALRENDLQNLFRQKAATALGSSFVPNFNFKDVQISYANVKPNFVGGELTADVAFAATAAPSFSADNFASSVAGKPVDEVRAAVAALPGLADGKVSVWPFWLTSVPSRQSKISVDAR